MSLPAGAKLGPYEVVAPLGAGGMGEVYRARDPRLGRDVAVKVLPESFSSDAERLRRFEQEARAASALNHPNILQVHDIGSDHGAPFVVSELLEGETLRERVGATPLPLRKAIDYAAQIAKGLSAAHDKGIVHRDLKPENVFVTRDGRVKLLDFGLAKLVVPAGGGSASDGPTATHGTDAGQLLGTVGYMSPEQVRARPVDHRSDIFSFGAVLYEMLSGQRAFRGASSIETMNAILKEDPPALSETNRQLPPGLERIVAHCLEKNPEERFQSAHDIAFDLEQLAGSSAATVTPLAPARRLRVGVMGLVAGILLALAVGLLAGRRLTQPRAASFDRVSFRRERINVARFAPDGRSVVYEAAAEGDSSEIVAVQLGSPESRSLGLQGARLSSVSSKGELAVRLRRRPGGSRTVARVPLGGGAPRDVVEDVEEADWGPDGETLAVLRWTGGGLTRLEYPPGTQIYEAPRMQRIRISPGGDRIAFTDHPVAFDDRGNIAVVDRAGRKTVLSRDWADLGSLAWSRDGSEVLFSGQRLGTEHSIHAVDLSGRERLVCRIPGSVDVEDIAADGRLLLSVRHFNPQIFGLGPGETRERDLSWLDYGYVRDLSQDGRTLLFDEQGLGGGPQYTAYIRAMDGSPPVRLGSGSGQALSPDGRWALVLDLKAPDHAVLLPTGAGQPRSLPKGRITQLHAGVFAADGKRLLLAANEAGRDIRLWEQDLEAGDPRPITEEGVNGPPSPDGKWVIVFTRDGIEIKSVDGSQPARPLAGSLPDDDVLRFTRDGRFVIVRHEIRKPAQYFRIDLATGRREPFKVIGTAAGSGRVMDTVIADDGKAYAYSYFDPVVTLYVADGLK